MRFHVLKNRIKLRKLISWDSWDECGASPVWFSVLDVLVFRIMLAYLCIAFVLCLFSFLVWLYVVFFLCFMSGYYKAKIKLKGRTNAGTYRRRELCVKDTQR